LSVGAAGRILLLVTDDRYEPLPPLPQLPLWLWRKASRGVRAAIVAVALVAVAGLVVLAALAPAEHRREARRRAAAHAALVRGMREDQRPRTAALPDGASIIPTLESGITRELRSRSLSAASTSCHRVTPRRTDGSLVPVAPATRYFKCFAQSAATKTIYGNLASGYYLYASADLGRRRLAWCKVNPRPMNANQGAALPPVSLRPPCVPEGW
jgi:hypothetical protein